MSTKEDQFKLAQKLQDAFRDCIKSCMDGNLTDFKISLQKLLDGQDHPCTIDELLLEFHSEGKTLFHIACSSGKENIVNYLLESLKSLTDVTKSRQFVNLKDTRGYTPLIYATISESYPIMKKLIDLGADVSARNEDGAAAIHFAAGDGNLERVKLLHQSGSGILETSKSGSPLHWAASKGHVEVIEYLISHGADVNQVGENGVPPVFIAAVAGSDLSVSLLVNAGADVGLIVSGNLTLLHICAEHGLENAVISILIKPAGVTSCNIRTEDGNTPLHLAAMSNHQLIMQKLLPFTTSLSEEELPSSLATEQQKLAFLAEDGQKRLKQWEAIHHHSSEENKEKSETNDHHSSSGHSTNSLNYFNNIPEPNYSNLLHEDKAEQFKQQGNNLLKEGKINEAIQAYSEAIQLNKYNSVFWSNRSAAYLTVKDYNQALIDAEVCRRLKPDWPKGCFRLASARLALKQYEDAALAAFEGCKLDPDNQELKKLLQDAVKEGQKEHQQKNNKKEEGNRK